MPLFVVVDSNTRGRKAKIETWGPYAVADSRRILDFARMGSEYGRPREVWFRCTGQKSERVRRYVDGKKIDSDGSPSEKLDAIHVLMRLRKLAKKCRDTRARMKLMRGAYKRKKLW